MDRRVAVALIGVLVLAGTGCGGGGGDAPADSASAGDSGASDVGTPRDTGGTTDVGSMPDVGTTPDVGTPSDAGAGGTRIVAAEGGVVVSEDGLFEIWIAPNGIAADTTISITRLDTADVPAALAALSPVSGVYALEPDGLVFARDSAYAHVIVPTLPVGVVTLGPPAQYPALDGASVPDAGGVVEHVAAAQTSYFDATAADVVYPLRHLSVHTVTTQNITVEVELGSRTQFVGEPWHATTRLIAEDPSRILDQTGALSDFVLSAGVTQGHPTVIDLVGGPTDPSDRILGHNLPAFLQSTRINGSALSDYVSVAREASLGPGDPVGAAGFSRDVRPPSDLEPRFVCTAIGDTEIYVGARVYYTDISPLHDLAPHERSFQVFASQYIDCVARPVIEARCDGQRVCHRFDDHLDCSDPPVVACDVTARPDTTTTEHIAGSPWYVTLSPAADPPSAGPSSITATSGGATMTGTRTATGTYDSSVSMGSTWDFTTPVTWTVSGEMPEQLDPPSALAVDYPDPLTDPLSADAHARFDGPFRHELEAMVRWAQSFDCHGVTVSDLTVTGTPDLASFVGGDTGFAAPVRDAIDHVASHCAIPVSQLETAPFYVEVRTTDTTRELPMTRVRVRTGESTRVDSSALTATCTGNRIYCLDRCVDPTRDPLNCGGCNRTPLEVCNALDDDCDLAVDEGCPGRIQILADSQTSPHFVDITRPAGTADSLLCSGSSVLNGVCGSVNPDGSIRQLRAACSFVTLRRITTTTPYTFAIDVTETPFVGSCEMGTTGGGWTGGAGPWSARCPAGMVADGFEGQETGNIEQIALHCSSWVVTQDATGLWLIRHGTRTTTTPGGTGSGTPFGPWLLADDPVDMQPAVIRTLHSRYFDPMMGNSDQIDLWGTGAWVQLRP